MTSISVSELRASAGGDNPPLIIDVRKPPSFLDAPDLIRGALRRDPLRVAEWAQDPARREPMSSSTACTVTKSARTPPGRGRTVSRRRHRGLARGRRRTVRQAQGREFALGDARAAEDRPHRLPVAGQALHRSGGRVSLRADAGREEGRGRAAAVPYDIPDVEFTHDGELCSFDAFIKRFRLNDPALDELAADRARRRHRSARSRAAVRGTAGDFPRPVPQLQR